MPIEADMIRTKILSGNIKIIDQGEPWSTKVYVDEKELTELWIIESFTYRADNTGTRVLKIKYREKPKEAKK